MNKVIYSSSNDRDVRRAIDDLVMSSPQHDYVAKGIIAERLDAWMAGESDDSTIKSLRDEIEELKSENESLENRISDARVALD